ncbi:hypothetical protein [Streptomyces sp. NPDC053048]|uniref:hypothetical protein n=1 Tax=Streptomyces sp. NPDC053048 TaxID=3365694 RepID=UPI0037CF5E61
MTRTTPPRPVDITAAFPELAAMARTTTRLHPRPGSPSVSDSSVGGPLLWPADEPWPMCDEWHGGYGRMTLDDVHTRRRILTAAWRRPRAPHADLLTPDERQIIDRASAGCHPGSKRPSGPVPLIPVAQLYARDIPGLACPEGTDTLQVLWCPFDHGDDYAPAVRLRWRRAADVTAVLTDPPVPELVGSDNYVPAPCVLHPEQVVEYPAGDDLPDDLRERVYAWEDEQESGCGFYQSDLSVAPGWKTGGWAAWWTFTDPAVWPLRCPCGAVAEPLVTIDSGEWDGGTHSWRPAEDVDPPDGVHYPSPNCPTMVTIGRGYTLQVYRCGESYEHPPMTVMQ